VFVVEQRYIKYRTFTFTFVGDSDVIHQDSGVHSASTEGPQTTITTFIKLDKKQPAKGQDRADGCSQSINQSINQSIFAQVFQHKYSHEAIQYEQLDNKASATLIVALN